MVVWEWVIVDGKRLPSASVLRGQPLVWDLDEWRERYTAHLKEHLLIDIFFSVIGVVILTDIGGLLRIIYLGILAIFIIGLGFLLRVPYLVSEGRILPPGLYETGIEIHFYPRNLYKTLLPYSEITEIEEIKRFYKSYIQLGTRHTNREWLIPKKFLGKKGVMALKAAIASYSFIETK